MSRLLTWGTQPAGAALGGVVAALLGLRAPFFLASISLGVLLATTLPIVNDRQIVLAKGAAGVGVEGDGRRSRPRPDYSRTQSLMLTAEQLAFTRGRHIAVLATVDGAGHAHAAPMWYAVEDTDIVMVTGKGSKKHRNLENSGRATVVIDHRTRPYYALMIDCGVDISSEETVLVRSKIAARYLVEPELSTYLDSRREADSVVVRLTPRSAAVYGVPPAS